MIILGVDPATTITGYAVLSCDRPRVHLLDCGCIKTNKKKTFALRLKQIYNDLNRIIAEFKPGQLALEEAFYSRNVKTALQIGHVRGVVMLVAAKNGIDTIEYSPREVKQAVTGNGNAAKIQVQSMVQRILQLEEPPSPFDVADALAIAICHCHRIQSVT